MHVFIDDSGCGGFKFDKNSTTHLVMAACVFAKPEDIEALAAAVGLCKFMNGRSREFKYSKTPDKVKDCFFDCVDTVPFRIRCIIIDKRRIYSPHLRSNPAALKSFAIRQLLTHTYRQVRDAKIVIDGQDTKAFGITDSDYLRKMVDRETPGVIRSVTFADSAQNVGLQLADMVAGCIRRGVEKGDRRHFERVRSRTWQPKGSYWIYR